MEKAMLEGPCYGTGPRAPGAYPPAEGAPEGQEGYPADQPYDQNYDPGTDPNAAPAEAYAELTQFDWEPKKDALPQDKTGVPAEKRPAEKKS